MGVVAFNRLCVGVAEAMTVFRQDVRQGFPMRWIQAAVCELVSCVIEPLAGCRITTTEPPGPGSPGAMIHGFDEPDVSCVDWLQCHTSSHALACISGGMGGAASVSARSRIPPSGVGRDTSNQLARTPTADVPSAYRRRHTAVVTAVACGLRWSPRTHCTHTSDIERVAWHEHTRSGPLGSGDHADTESSVPPSARRGRSVRRKGPYTNSIYFLTLVSPRLADLD